MKHIRPLVLVCFTLWLAACGGGDLALSLPDAPRDQTHPEETPDQPLRLDFPPGRPVEHQLPFRISGGVPPYEASIDGCPTWVILFPDQRILAGTAPVSEGGQTFFCTYVVTDSAILGPPQSRSFGLRLEVESSAALQLTSPAIPELNIGVFYGSEPLPRATGGVQPYTYSFTCAGGALPAGMGFAPETRVFAGTPDAQFHDSCTYSVTDSSQPAMTASQAVEVLVNPLELGTWRFRTRTIEPGGPCVVPTSQGPSTEIAILPHAHGGEAGQDSYALLDFPNNHFLAFDAHTRRLAYNPPAVPILGTPNTYRYLVGAEGVNAKNAADALCLDIQFNPGVDFCPDPDGSGDLEPSHTTHILLQVRDDAYWDANAEEYRCPDSTAPAPRSSARKVSPIPSTPRLRLCMHGAQPTLPTPKFETESATGRPGPRVASRSRRRSTSPRCQG